MNQEDSHSTKVNAAKVGEKLMASRPTGPTRVQADKQQSAAFRRLPSSTPPQKNMKGKVPSPKAKSSTPSGSISTTPTRSFNLSPIASVSHSSKVNTDKMEPKILKPLGPQLSVNDRKYSTRSVESLNANTKSINAPDLRALYMMYQQQLYLNGMMENTKDRVTNEGKQQLDELWSLMKAMEADTADIEARTDVVENHSRLSQLVDVIKPVLKETKVVIDKVAGDYQRLAQALDTTRHKIHLTNIHPIEGDASAGELIRLMDKAAATSADVQSGNLDEMVRGAVMVSRLDDDTKQQVQLLEQCQSLSQVALTRLGQELFLSQDDVAYRKLSEFDV